MIAIETGIALRMVFHQPLRQTEDPLRSIADVLGVDTAIPDHTTLSRRGGGLAILLKRPGCAEPLHLLVDNKGLKIYGEGEWLDQKRGIRSRRRRRKLHLWIDAMPHEIVASELMPDGVGDVSEMPALLVQIDAEVASMTADGGRLRRCRRTSSRSRGDHSTQGDGSFERINDEAARSTYCSD